MQVMAGIVSTAQVTHLCPNDPRCYIIMIREYILVLPRISRSYTCSPSENLCRSRENPNKYSCCSRSVSPLRM